MPADKRTPLQDEVVRALIETKAIDFEAVGALFSKFGARGGPRGRLLVNIINKHVTGPAAGPDPRSSGPGHRPVPAVTPTSGTRR